MLMWGLMGFPPRRKLMAPEASPSFDWDRQLEDLGPYLEEQGGVVHVWTGPSGPVSSFARALRSLMANGEWKRPWTSVQIDNMNPETHYLSDVVRQIARSVGIELPSSDGSTANIEVGTNIEAGGDVDVSDNVILVAADPYDRAEALSKRLDSLESALRRELRTRRVALVVLNAHDFDPRNLRTLQKELWGARLRALTDLGLLLVDISDPLVLLSKKIDYWPPPPNLTLDLPDMYGEAERASAARDLGAFAVEAGLADTPEQGKEFARQILSLSHNVAQVYTNVAIAVAARGKQ